MRKYRGFEHVCLRIMLKLGCNRRHCPSSSASRAGPQDNRLHLHPRPSALFAKPPREPFSTRAKIHRSLFEFAAKSIHQLPWLSLIKTSPQNTSSERSIPTTHHGKPVFLPWCSTARSVRLENRNPAGGAVIVGMLRRRFGLLAGVITLSLIALYHGPLRTISSFSRSGAVSLDPDELKLYIGNIDSLLVEHPKRWPGK